MELLLSKNPIVAPLGKRSIEDYFKRYVEEASSFNVATGFISSDSIATLQQILEYKNGGLNLNLFIGMNYLDGFTKVQYEAVKDLNSYLHSNNLGSVYLSDSALYHGKMYSFRRGNVCLGSFIGSSNLSSFVGSNQNYIESDILFKDSDGEFIYDCITGLIHKLGTSFNSIPTITEFREPEIELLRDYSYVDKVSKDELETIKRERTGETVKVPLKTEAKSNLNSYFGKGKIKNKYSPRGWYEVEIIISKKTPNIDLLPDKEHGPFKVFTDDGYSFYCERQGDYSKNFRSCKDLKILGRWIKGRMENEAALKVGQPVTEHTLQLFGKSNLVLEKLSNDAWYLSMQ